MNKKLENFFILSDIFIFFYLFVLYFLIKFFSSDGIGLAGVFWLVAPLPLAICFLMKFFYSINKPINKNNNRWITVTSIILFFIALYLIFFGVGLEIGAEPLAKSTKSKLVCQMIISDFEKESCLRDVVALRGDKSICVLIKDYSKKDQCYWRVAEQTLDIELCKKIVGDKSMCVIAVAEYTGNKEYCDYMPENGIFFKDFCIKMVGN